MQTSNKVLRRTARQNMIGQFRVPMLAFLTAEMLLLIAEDISTPSINSQMTPLRTVLFVLTSFVISIASAIFTAGFIRIHMGLARKENILSRMVFYGFRFHIERYLVAALLTELILCIPLLPFFIALIYFIAVKVSVLSIVILTVCGIVSLVLAIWVTLRLSLTFFLLVDKDELSAVKAIRISWGQMKCRCAKLLGLYLSFLPLMLAAVCSFGIGLLWLQPYMEQVLTLFYFDVTGQDFDKCQ